MLKVLKEIEKNKRVCLLITLLLMFIACGYNIYYSYSMIGNTVTVMPWGMTCRRMMLIVIVFVFISLHFIFDISKMYDFIFRKRFWIAIVIFAFMVINKFNFSSIGLFDAYVQPGEGSVYVNPVFGTPRAIRSDEWMVTAPRLMTTDYAGYGETNNIVRATETNNLSASGLQGGYSILARPAYLGFYIFHSSDYGLAWMWNFYIIFGCLAIFELCYIITKGNRLLAIFGAVLIGFSQFSMWWSLTTFIYTGSAAVACFKHFIDEKSSLKKLCFGTGMSMAIANFVVDLYPAWQVPASYIFLAIVIWIIIDSRKEWMRFKAKEWGILIIVLAFLISITFAYLYKYQDYMNAVMNTVYPGSRVCYGGNSISKLYGYLLSAMSPIVNFANPSEMGCIFGVFPLAPILLILVLIKKHGKSLILWLLAIPTAIMTIYCTVGLPPIIAKCTLLTFSTDARVTDIVGLGCAFIVIICLNEIKDDKLPVWLATIITIFCMAIAVRYSYTFGIRGKELCLAIGIAIITVICEIFILSDFGKVCYRSGLIMAILFVFGTGIVVNPLMYGTYAIKSKPLADEVSEIMQENPESKWLALDNLALGNYLIACGAPTYNSTNYIPNMELWKKFDPDGVNEEIYNRYAHIVISLTTEPTTMELVQGDMFRVNLCYLDLDKFDVDYLCCMSPLDESIGVTKEYEHGGIFIYKINNK